MSKTISVDHHLTQTTGAINLTLYKQPIVESAEPKARNTAGAPIGLPPFHSIRTRTSTLWLTRTSWLLLARTRRPTVPMGHDWPGKLDPPHQWLSAPSSGGHRRALVVGNSRVRLVAVRSLSRRIMPVQSARRSPTRSSTMCDKVSASRRVPARIATGSGPRFLRSVRFRGRPMSIVTVGRLSRRGWRL